MNTKKALLDAFEQHLLTDFEAYCERQELPLSTSELLTFLLDQELLSPPRVRHYTVVKEYHYRRQPRYGHKTSVVSLIADRFKLSERTIWNILREPLTDAPAAVPDTRLKAKE